MQHWWRLRFRNFGHGLLQLTCFYILLWAECRSYRLIEVVYEFVKSRENLFTDHPRGVFVSKMCLSTGCWRQSRIMQQLTIGRCSLRNRRLGQIMCHDHCFMLVVHGSSAPAGFLVYAPTARGSPTIGKFRQRLFHDHRVVVFGLTDVFSQYMFSHHLTNNNRKLNFSQPRQCH